MMAALLTTILPGGSVKSPWRSAAEKYSLYLAQQAAHHHYDSLVLALGVLKHLDEPKDRVEWLQRIAESADKCAAAISDCMERAD